MAGNTLTIRYGSTSGETRLRLGAYLVRLLSLDSRRFPQICASEFGTTISNGLAFYVMERERFNQDHEPQSDFLPDGWMLVNRHDSPNGTFLWMARVDANPARNWVTVFGSTYEEALRAGWIRARLYDEISRSREA